MAAGLLPHHHRSTTTVLPKTFKSRFASKSELDRRARGKTDGLEKGTRKTPHQQVMSKLDRRNQAKQRRRNKQNENTEKTSVFAGRDGAPRIVAVVPLCDDVESEEVVRRLNESVDVYLQGVQIGDTGQVEIPRFKQKVQYLAPSRDLFACLDACQVADFVLLVLSATNEVDKLGEQILRCIECQGVSTVITGIFSLDTVEPAKKRADVVKCLQGFITHFFASQEKLLDLSNRQDCSNVMRSLCATMPKGIKWRDDRSWMLVEEVRWWDESMAVTGVVRGKGLKADRLVQLGNWGDFQVEKITAAPLEHQEKRLKTGDMVVGTGQDEPVLERPSENGDDLAELAPEEATMDDAVSMPITSFRTSERKHVLLDDHQYFDEDEQDEPEPPKRLPRGTSKYQAAWYLGDVSESDSDLEDIGGDVDSDMHVDASVTDVLVGGDVDQMMADPTEVGEASEYPHSEVFEDHAPDEEAEEIVAHRKRRRGDETDDLEFPDEIELHPHVSARERLARYRGLKNFRTSSWDTEEDRLYQPHTWPRLLEIVDYKSAKNRVFKEASTGGVKAGTRVNVHLLVSPEQRSRLRSLPKPTALVSLLRHEHKRTAVNTFIALSSENGSPLKSKDPLILQCGPRRLWINPLFSQAGNTPNNVHKFDRYLHPGRTAVASFIGPMTWGSVPCLYFQPTRSSVAVPDDPIESLAETLKRAVPSPPPKMVATGTTLAPSINRVIAKRVILTGHPYKIHKRLVTVRYMFFNAEDVQYFRALKLWTKRGRSGFVKEALGTHGYFKATFDGKVGPMDAVAVSLYKRVWPRWARIWRAGEDASEHGEMTRADEADCVEQGEVR